MARSSGRSAHPRIGTPAALAGVATLIATAVAQAPISAGRRWPTPPAAVSAAPPVPATDDSPPPPARTALVTTITWTPPPRVAIESITDRAPRARHRIAPPRPIDVIDDPVAPTVDDRSATPIALAVGLPPTAAGDVPIPVGPGPVRTAFPVLSLAPVGPPTGPVFTSPPVFGNPVVGEPVDATGPTFNAPTNVPEPTAAAVALAAVMMLGTGRRTSPRR